MPIVASRGTNGAYVPAPEGEHDAILEDVADLGEIETSYNGEKKTQHKIRFVFGLGAKMDDGRPFTIGRRYTLTLHEKGALYKDLRSWFGRPPPETLDLEKLIGQPARIIIQHSERDGQVYGNISAILKPGKTRLKPNPDFVRFKDREPKPAIVTASANTPIAGDDDVPF